MSQSGLWGAGGVCWQRWQKKHNISVIIADNLATTQYGPGADVLPHYCCFKIMIDAILLRDLFCKTWMYYRNWKPIDISFTPNQFLPTCPLLRVWMDFTYILQTLLCMSGQENVCLQFPSFFVSQYNILPSLPCLLPNWF